MLLTFFFFRLSSRFFPPFAKGLDLNPTILSFIQLSWTDYTLTFSQSILIAQLLFRDLFSPFPSWLCVDNRYVVLPSPSIPIAPSSPLFLLPPRSPLGHSFILEGSLLCCALLVLLSSFLPSLATSLPSASCRKSIIDTTLIFYSNQSQSLVPFESYHLWIFSFVCVLSTSHFLLP